MRFSSMQAPLSSNGKRRFCFSRSMAVQGSLSFPLIDSDSRLSCLAHFVERCFREQKGAVPLRHNARPDCGSSAEGFWLCRSAWASWERHRTRPDADRVRAAQPLPWPDTPVACAQNPRLEPVFAAIARPWKPVEEIREGLTARGLGACSSRAVPSPVPDLGPGLGPGLESFVFLAV